MVIEKSSNINKINVEKIVISHGILQILSLNVTKCVPLFLKLSILASVGEVLIFQHFPQNIVNAESKQSHG